VFLTTGARVGPYEILGAIGAGGMGEVYRALDTKLDREVAIKVLPELFVSDPERVARFQREAKTLASLNHPHIGGIYGLEDTAGVHALVLELVDGPTLADRIAQGPIPVDETLAIAKQIAEALQAAHEQGIIHRDLKPANIKLRPDGTVKVLDFGLAKAIEPTSAASASVTASPTITTPAMMTGVGMILGTAAYMSPEQAKGRPADKRSDVWAFGCVLYEMLAGARAFEGEDVTDTLATILKSEPSWEALPPSMPPNVRAIAEGCLRKDRQHRVGDISIVLFLLNQPPLGSGAQQATAAAPGRPLGKRLLPLAAAAVIGAVITGTAAWSVWPLAPRATITRFTLSLPEGQTFANTGRQVVAISPDGTRIVYRATAGLTVRSLANLDARVLPGTESTALTNPVFSPDGQSIAFFQSGTIKRIAVAGGAAVTICAAENPLGMTWQGDEILFGQPRKGILRVSANGGTPEELIAVKSDERAHGPQRLPGGQAILFTLATESGPNMWDTSQIVVQSLTSGERKTLVPVGSDARYLVTGHLIYATGGIVFAVPFNHRRLAVVGGPAPVIEGVSRATNASSGTAQFGVSENGTLVFVPGPVSSSAFQQDVAFRDRQGVVQPLKLPLAPYEHPRVSPDGTRLAVETDDGKEAIVWIYDLSGASSRRQLTFGGRNQHPIWSADGQRVTFSSNREGDVGLFSQRADGASPAERLTRAETGAAHVPQTWTPDGKTLLFTVKANTKAALWTYSTASKQAVPYGGIEADLPQTVTASLSPDGRWLTYGSTGTFVEPFPATGSKYRVSGFIHPFWSPDGTELFSIPRGRFAATAITTKPSFAFSTPIESSAGGLLERGPTNERNTDIMPDGKRFIGIVAIDQEQSGAATGPRIQVVEHWFEELKARVPAR
jgi:eukaryotic-like serine/threonine-protein kinase